MNTAYGPAVTKGLCPGYTLFQNVSSGNRDQADQGGSDGIYSWPSLRHGFLITPWLGHRVSDATPRPARPFGWGVQDGLRAEQNPCGAISASRLAGPEPLANCLDVGIVGETVRRLRARPRCPGEWRGVLRRAACWTLFLSNLCRWWKGMLACFVSAVLDSRRRGNDGVGRREVLRSAQRLWQPRRTGTSGLSGRVHPMVPPTSRIRMDAGCAVPGASSLHVRPAQSRSIALAAASPWAMAVGTEGWGESVMSPAA